MSHSKSIVDLQTEVNVQVIDNQGSVIHDITDSNTETLWAKINTPVSGTLQLDLITDDPQEQYGVELSQINRTCYTELDTLRSNKLSTSFSLSDKTYTCSFSWYNDTGASVLLYGLLSYVNPNIYSTFDMTSSPLEVTDGSTVIGTYKITYDNATPTLTSGSTIHQTWSGQNTCISGLRDALHDATVDYKLTRVFTKTSIYFGAKVSDTLFTSNMVVAIAKKRLDNTDIFSKYAVEIFYKCLSSGNPQGATVVRYAKMPLLKKFHKSWHLRIDTNVPYILDVEFNVDYGNTTSASTAWFVASAQNETPVTIKPYRRGMPPVGGLNIRDIEAFAYRSDKWGPDFTNYTSTRSNDYARSFRQIVPTTFSVYYPFYVAYWYWDETPTIQTQTYMRRDVASQYTKSTLSIWVNGQQFNPTKTYDKLCGTENYYVGSGSYNAGLAINNYNLSSLGSSGSGVVVIAPSWSDEYTYAKDYLPWMAIASNMYGYVVPYAGFFTDESSEIESDWISTSYANISGVDGQITFTPNTTSECSTIGLVQDKNVATAMNALTGHKNQTDVYVTAEQADKVAGVIKKGNTGYMVCTKYYDGYGYAGLTDLCTVYAHALPYYVTDANFVHWGQGFSNLQDSTITSVYKRWNGQHLNPAWAEALHTRELNDSLIADVENRTVTYNNDNAFKPYEHSVAASTGENECIIARKQGTTTYDIVVPKHMAPYSEGTPTVSWGGNVYEIETTLETTEHIGDIQLTFDNNSIFTAGEYISFSTCGKRILPTDSLETWKLVTADRLSGSTLDTHMAAMCVCATEMPKADDLALYVDSSELLSAEVEVPKPTVQISNNTQYTHILTYTVTLPVTDKHHVSLPVPKMFEHGGDTLYTNVESVYLTDGMHVLPWSLNKDHEVRPQQVHDSGELQWVLAPNMHLLRDLYTANTSIILHAYVVAKQKDEWLPMTVPVYSTAPTKYIDNNGPLTAVLLQSDTTEGDTTFINSSTLSDSHAPVRTGSTIAHSTNQAKFGASSLRFQKDGAVLLTDCSAGATSSMSNDFTVDMWVYVEDLSTEPYLFVSWRSIESTAVEGFYYDYGWYVSLDTAGAPRIRWGGASGPWSSGKRESFDMSYSTVQGADNTTVELNTWTHIGIVANECGMRVFVNGVTSTAHTWTTDMYRYAPMRGAYIGGNNFQGYMDEVHVTHAAIWVDDFEPPTHPWGSAAIEEEGVRFKDGAIHKIELPIALDTNINVVDDATGSDVAYLHADPINKKLISDGCSNALYVSMTSLELQEQDTQKVAYLAYPVRGSIGTYQDTSRPRQLIGAYASLTQPKINTRSKDWPLNAYNANPYATTNMWNFAHVCAHIMDKRYKDIGYKFIDKHTIHDGAIATLRIEASNTNNSAEPEDIFYGFRTGANIMDGASGTAPTSYPYPDYAFFSNANTRIDVAAGYHSAYYVNNLTFDTRIASPGIHYSTRHDDAYGRYATVINEYAKVLSCNVFSMNLGTAYRKVLGYNHLYSTHIAPSGSSTYPGFYLRDRYRTTSNTEGATSNDNKVASIAAYIANPSLYTHNDALNLSFKWPGILSYNYMLTDSGSRKVQYRTDGPYGNYWPVYDTEASLINVQSMQTAEQFLYSTQKDILLGDTRVYKLDNLAIADAASIDIRTYVVTSFEQTFATWVNEVGNHVLTDTTGTMTYDVIVSNRFMEGTKHAYTYAYTKNAEFISLMISNSLNIGMEVGYISDVYADSDIVPAGTAYSATPTSTIVFPKQIFGVRQLTNAHMMDRADPDITPFGMTAFRAVAKQQEGMRPDAFRIDNIKHFNCIVNSFEYHNWIDKDWQDTDGKMSMYFTQYPYFNKHSIRELYANKHLAAPMNTSSAAEDTVGVAAPMVYELQTGAHTYKTSGAMASDALHVDARVIARSNIQYNVLFDTTALPIDDIDSLGKVSLNIHTDAFNKDIFQYLLLCKVVDTDTSEEHIYALNKHYYTVEKINTLLDNIDVAQAEYINERYLSNHMTYEPFNALLTAHAGNSTLSIGVMLYASEVGRLCVLNALSCQIQFNNEAHYVRPEWCYVNEEAEVLSDNAVSISSDVAMRKVRVYNPNSIQVSDYAVRIDVSAYDFTSFLDGIVAQMPDTTPIPTIYEKDDTGKTTTDFNEFNGKGLWVKVPSIFAEASVELTLVDVVNSYPESTVFTLYDNFDNLNSSTWDFSWTEDLSLTATETDNGTGAESTSERVGFIGKYTPIQLVDNKLHLSGDVAASLTTTSSALRSDEIYEMQYTASDTSNLQVAFGDVPSVAEKTLEYYHETPDSSLTFISTDLHKGDNTFYVYYTGGSTNHSTSDIFHIFDDFSDTDIPNWYTYNYGDNTLTTAPNQVTLTNTASQLRAHNTFSPNRGWGGIVSMNTTSRTNYSRHMLMGVVGDDSTRAGISTNSDTVKPGMKYIAGIAHPQQTEIDLPTTDSASHTYMLNVYGFERIYMSLNKSGAVVKDYYGYNPVVYQIGKDVGDNVFMLGSSGGYVTYYSSSAAYTTGSMYASNAITAIYTKAIAYHAPSKTPSPLQYGVVETGPWTINGTAYTNRIKVVLPDYATTDEDVCIALDRTQWNSLLNIDITSLTNTNAFDKTVTDVCTVMIGAQEQSVLGDIADTTELIPYWYLANDTTWLPVYIKTDLVYGDNEFYVYSTGDGTSAASATDVFDFYDDFASGVIDEGRWYVRFDNEADYEVAVNHFRVVKTPAYVRSHVLHAGEYDMLARTKAATTTAYNGIATIYNNYADAAASTVYSDASYGKYTTVGHMREARTLGACNTMTSRNAQTSERTVAFTHTKARGVDNRSTLITTGFDGRLYGYPSLYYAGLGHVRSRWLMGDFIGCVYAGTSATYPVATGNDMDTSLYWAASWDKTHIDYDCKWGTEEEGSWVVDGNTYTRRIKVTIHAYGSDTGVVLRFRNSDPFHNDTNIRIARTVRTGQALTYIDSHRNTTTLRFQPYNNAVYVERSVADNTYDVADKVEALPIKTPEFGKLGIAVSTGSDKDSVKIDWVRSRKHYPKELIQLKPENVSVLMQNLYSDWYIMDVTAANVKAADMSAINTAIAENASRNHEAALLEKWQDFPCASLIRNGPYSYGKHISYRN